MAYLEGPKKGFNFPPGYIDYIQSSLEVVQTGMDKDKVYFKIVGKERLYEAYKCGVRLTIGYYYDDGSGGWSEYKRYDTSYGYLDSGWYPGGGLVYNDYFTRFADRDRKITFYAEAKGISHGGYGTYNGTSETKIVMTVPKKEPEILVPNPPLNQKATWVNDNQIDITWTKNPASQKPVDGTWVDRKRNEEAYSDTIALPKPYTGTSFSDKNASIIQPNNRYIYRLKHHNSVGGSPNYVYTNYVYTTPAKPLSGQAIGQGGSNKFSVSCDCSGTRYLGKVEWQRASSQSFSDAVTLSGTGVAITDTSPTTTPWYRARTVSPDGLRKSDWMVITSHRNPTIWVNIPPGATIKDILIRR